MRIAAGLLVQRTIEPRPSDAGAPASQRDLPSSLLGLAGGTASSAFPSPLQAMCVLLRACRARAARRLRAWCLVRPSCSCRSRAPPLASAARRSLGTNQSARSLYRCSHHSPSRSSHTTGRAEDAPAHASQPQAAAFHLLPEAPAIVPSLTGLGTSFDNSLT